MNGTLGRVVSVAGRPISEITVDFEGELHTFSEIEAQEVMELAYAISVHKAQGSQFKRVAIVVTRSRLLNRALIYTALTRGVEQVVFVGSRHVLDVAMREPAFILQRCVGLFWGDDI